MKARSVSFSLFVVIGTSIVFGIVLGGWIHPPQVALAAAPSPLIVRPAPALSNSSGIRDFADVAEASMSAVVSVTSRDDGERDESDDDSSNPVS